jgi:hypothetical protein
LVTFFDKNITEPKIITPSRMWMKSLTNLVFLPYVYNYYKSYKTNLII